MTASGTVDGALAFRVDTVGSVTTTGAAAFVGVFDGDDRLSDRMGASSGSGRTPVSLVSSVSRAACFVLLVKRRVCNELDRALSEKSHQVSLKS